MLCTESPYTETDPTEDYKRGWSDGLTDANLLCQPVGTNGHTYDQWVRIRNKLVAAIYTFPDHPTDYQRGYADVHDVVAIERVRLEPGRYQLDPDQDQVNEFINDALTDIHYPN